MKELNKKKNQRDHCTRKGRVDNRHREEKGNHLKHHKTKQKNMNIPYRVK